VAEQVVDDSTDIEEGWQDTESVGLAREIVILAAPELLVLFESPL
jgi:hypothetical protein